MGTMTAPRITQTEQFEIYRAELESMVRAEEEAEARALKSAEEAVVARIKAEQEWKDAVLKASDEAAKERIKLAEEEAKAAAKMREAWATAAGSMAAELANKAIEGELNLQKLGNMLLKVALQMAAMQAGGPWGAALASFAGGFKGFAHGGVIHEGHGGTDSQIVAFRKSPNERVTIETPLQQRDGSLRGGSESGRGVTNVIVQNDAREIVSGLRTGAGEAEIVRLNRKFRRRN
jgi:hypothetical protein